MRELVLTPELANAQHRATDGAIRAFADAMFEHLPRPLGDVGGMLLGNLIGRTIENMGAQHARELILRIFDIVESQGEGILADLAAGRDAKIRLAEDQS